MPEVDSLSSLYSSSNMDSADFTNCAPGFSFSGWVRERLLLPEVKHYLDLAGWAPESLLRSVAKNAAWEGLITKASNPDSNLQKYGEVQRKSWKWFATFCSNQPHE